MLWLKVGVTAAIAWWLTRPEFKVPTGDVTIGDDWTATFLPGNGQWSDAYKSPVDPSSLNARQPGTP